MPALDLQEGPRGKALVRTVASLSLPVAGADQVEGLCPAVALPVSFQQVGTGAKGPTSRLMTDAGTLIQLAQVNHIAAHAAHTLGQGSWDLAELASASMRLRALTPTQIMRVVSDQALGDDASTESTPAISIAGRTISANTFGVRVFLDKSADVILEYRRVGATDGYRLVGWR